MVRFILMLVALSIAMISSGVANWSPLLIGGGVACSLLTVLIIVATIEGSPVRVPVPVAPSLPLARTVIRDRVG